MKEYTLVPSDARDAEQLEQVLNVMASDGWRFSFIINGSWIYMERDIVESGYIKPMYVDGMHG